MRGLRLRAEKAEPVGEHYTQIVKKKTVYKVQILIVYIISYNFLEALMAKQYKPYSIIKENNICPRCSAKVKIGVLLEEEHYFTKSKLILVYTCDKCGKKWTVNYK